MKLVFFLTCAVSVMASTVFGAAGAILVDEDFEDGTAFEDMNWPVFNEARAPQLDEVALWQGYEIRADVIGSTKPMVAPVITPATGAYVTTDRFFTGAQSLCLASNSTTPSTSLVNPEVDPTYGASADRVWRPEIWAAFQVAVSMNASTTADPWPAPGTQVCRVRYKIDSGGVKNFDVKFVTNSSTSVDIISVHPNGVDETTIGEGTPGRGNWAMVSFILQASDISTTTTDRPDRLTPITEPWVCHDIMNLTEGRNIYIGPQPINPLHFSEAGYGELANYAQVLSGVGVYVNSDSPGVQYLPVDIDPTFGDGSDDVDGFEILANSGDMDIYIDDLFWDVGAHDDPEWGANGLTLAQAARMQPFTGVIDPAWGPQFSIETPELAVRDWMFYE
jgi:hypothetical protein